MSEISWVLAKSPDLAGLRAGAGSLRVARSAPEGNFGTFVSGLKIPFPGNRDRAKQRLVRMRRRRFSLPAIRRLRPEASQDTTERNPPSDSNLRLGAAGNDDRSRADLLTV